MPLGAFEQEVLRLLAVNRNPDSYVAGATVLNQNPASPRTSRDVDFFHDTVDSLARSTECDIELLRANGFEVIEAGRRHDTFCRAQVRRGGRQTKIEWAFDSAFRFFPVEPDPELGWRLNFWDVAVNKVLAFAGRAEVRDWVDVLHLHQQHLHVGALAWAGTGKDPGLSPEAIIRWAGRQAVYRPEDLADLTLSEPVTLPQLKEQWLEASSEALELIARLPPGEVGCLYLDRTGKPVRPNPSSPEFSKLTRHFGTVKGAWPRIFEGGG
ncbi:MAG TPA: nucleotidyl transferase AbiEii/AbiGii toxin family protein [Verrucomicrobiae bacterium]|nr:nucleotidyl transferase AbiEii/AbiGii toxin family protein [Verrucomicrobiae bacterium]